MSNTLNFRVQSLLEQKKEGSISGPMSPLEFANEKALQCEFKFNRLARIWLDDEKIFQKWEGDGLTGHDTLIIGCQYKNDLWLSLWVDMGISGAPVAMCYDSDRKVITTPLYRQQKFARKLTDEQILQVFTYIFENPHEINIKNFQPDVENVDATNQ